jgi:ketosteroid isomerase-like protein
MPSHNVELVRDAYARWRKGDYEEVHEFLCANATKDVELHSRFAGLAGEPYRGHDGLRSWLDEIQEHFERFEPWLDEARDVGDERVLALGGISFRARGSGLDMDESMGWIHEFRDGKLCRMNFFASPADALASAGLER